MAFKIEVDQDACVGCGACEAAAPEVFALNDDGKAEPKKAEVENDSEAQEGAEACPVSCITISKIE